MLRHMLIFAHAFCSCICYFSAFLPQFCFCFRGRRTLCFRPGQPCQHTPLAMHRKTAAGVVRPTRRINRWRINPRRAGRARLGERQCSRTSTVRLNLYCFTVVFTISIGAPHLHVRAVTDDIDINIRHPTVASYTYVLLDAVACTSVQLCPAGCWSRRRCCAAVCLCVVVCCCCTCGAVRISNLFLAPYFCILHFLSFRIQR